MIWKEPFLVDLFCNNKIPKVFRYLFANLLYF